MKLAHRLEPLQTNVFADMDRAKARARAAGKTIIDLSLGSSDLPTAPFVLDAIATALRDPSTHGYALFQSTQPLRQAIAAWYERRYGLAVDPETEVLPLIGSQEGTAHLPLAVMNPGDVALLLDPGYPSHAGGVYLAGGEIHTLPLRAENQFLPDLEAIPAAIVARSRLLVLSYPHNPTTAIAPLSFFQQAVAFCRAHQIVLVNDFPYADFVFPGSPPAPSIFQADRQRELGIEIYSFSKSYNMGGFRIGYAIGNAELIRGLRQVKAIVDFNQYRGIMRGAIAALDGDQAIISETVRVFQQRRDAFVSAMHASGWSVPVPDATLYIWAKLPAPWQNRSVEFCMRLVEATGVAVSPGAGFGKTGEGYLRFALVRKPEILTTAVAKIAEFLATAT
ncbi:MAG: LL-diaminopimelate aminotransferase [Spirulinaceae cyanobacterium SM2_1_0]|nr:LL-diaminopimelate aminotransferase [Spirulinaceae cyanobacterium SM2_1_0]